MSDLFQRTGYLLDPHGAVAVAGAEQCREKFAGDIACVSVATAHPAKFPEVIKQALPAGRQLPEAALHPSIEMAKQAATRLLTCRLEELEHRLQEEIETSLRG